MTKFYADADGVYLGGFDGAEPPVGAIEVPSAPAHAAAIWSGLNWVEPAPAVPRSVPMLNARLTLIGAGKMAAVRAYLDAIPGIEGEQAREYFLSSLTMLRDHPLVLGIPPEIMTEAEKDALFIAAGALNV